jgi:hypothetical protein
MTFAFDCRNAKAKVKNNYSSNPLPFAFALPTQKAKGAIKKKKKMEIL